MDPVWPARLNSMRPYEYLDLIGRKGSIQACADAYGYSQPAVSSVIRRLEKSLGVALLRRRGRAGCELTAEGDLIVAWFRRLAVAARAFDGMVHDSLDGTDGAGDAGRYRIAASTTTSELLLPRWIMLLELELEREAEAINVSLVSTRSSRVIDAVRLGEADIGFIADASEADSLEDMQLQSRAVGSDEIVVVAGNGPRAPWPGRTEIELAELTQQPQVARDEGSGALDAFREALRRAGASRIPIAHRYNSSTDLRQAVIEQGHPAAMSSLAVTEQVASGALRVLKIKGLGPIPRTRRVIWRQGEERSDVTDRLIRIAVNNPSPTSRFGEVPDNDPPSSGEGPA